MQKVAGSTLESQQATTSVLGFWAFSSDSKYCLSFRKYVCLKLWKPSISLWKLSILFWVLLFEFTELYNGRKFIYPRLCPDLRLSNQWPARIYRSHSLLSKVLSRRWISQWGRVNKEGRRGQILADGDFGCDCEADDRRNNCQSRQEACHEKKRNEGLYDGGWIISDLWREE